MRAHDLAASLSRMIETSVWNGGQRLPPERELCETFGTARNTVRRALELLEHSRLIVRRPGRGCFVSGAPGPAPAAADFLGNVLKASPADILELRFIVEPAVAALAAALATADDLERIRAACAAIETSGSVDEREARDAEFHLALFRATRNPLLVSLCEAINLVRDRTEWVSLKERTLSPERRGQYDAQHAAIVAAIGRRSADEARHAAQEHLNALRRDLLGAYAR
ncbi:MAG: FadR/GntR family transcriptional regulator [Alphaproteobacteria bacterium]